jgi:maltodextrin utilization protein YvdJ
MFNVSICLYHHFHSKEDRKAHFMLAGLGLPLLAGAGFGFEMSDAVLMLPWGILVAIIMSSIFHFVSTRRQYCELHQCG